MQRDRSIKSVQGCQGPSNAHDSLAEFDDMVGLIDYRSCFLVPAMRLADA